MDPKRKSLDELLRQSGVNLHSDRPLGVDLQMDKSKQEIELTTPQERILSPEAIQKAQDLLYKVLPNSQPQPIQEPTSEEQAKRQALLALQQRGGF